MENKCQHLKMTKSNKLLKLLQKCEELFDGKLGTWKKYPVHFELKDDAKPILSRPYPVPTVHGETFKKEVECSVVLGVLKLSNNSEQGVPYFAQTTPKYN